MTAKEYLGQIQDLNLQIESLKRQRAEITILVPQTYDDISLSDSQKIAARSKTQKMADARMLTIENNITRLIREKTNAVQDIAGRITELNNGKQRTVLWLKYCEGMSLNEISEKMHYSYRQVKRLHKAAMMELERNLNDKK